MVMRSRTPWSTKLHPAFEAQVVRERRGRMLVPTPLLVAAELRRVPRGRLITPELLRIFLNILAGAAEEALAEGRRPVAPYWRVVDPTGRLSPKFPPGPARQAAHLRAEGHSVARDHRVRDAEASLVRR